MRQTLRRCVAALVAMLPGVIAHAQPSVAAWPDYQIIMWQPHSSTAMRSLQQIGVTGLQVRGRGGNIEPTALAAATGVQDRIYLENIATDFYSPYHIAGSNALYMAAKAAYAANPADPAAFERKPSLVDPVALAKLHDLLTGVVRKMSPYQPLYYSLGDEMGIAETSSQWDFDISPPALADFRAWLQGHYASLAALNAEWGTVYNRWENVQPMLTDSALLRADGNYAGWGDFKQWSDDSFAAALRFGTNAIHEADPAALSAMEGTQVPGWGGYDYSRISSAVDVMEVYDSNHSFDLAHAFAPDLILLTTTFSADRSEQHRLWRDVLLGARGHVIWDGENDYVSEDGKLGPRGLASAALFGELRAGIPTQFITSESAPAEVAILASMPSLRIEWLLARKGETTSWTKRIMDDDYAPSPWRIALDRAADGLEHLGVPVRYLSPEALGQGVPSEVKLLVLPRSAALSDEETKSISTFVARGGVVLADGTPGEYDLHLRHRPTPSLAAIANKIVSGSFLQKPDLTAVQTALRPIVAQAGVVPMLRLSTPDGRNVSDVSVRLWRNGEVTLIGVQRDLAASSATENVVLHLNAPQHVTDLRAHADLGTDAVFPLTLDPVFPTILAVTSRKLALPELAGPERLGAGQVAEYHVSLPAASPEAARVVHLEWQGPSAEADPRLSANVILHGGQGSYTLPSTATPTPGSYILRSVDILTGTTDELPVEVSPSAH